MVTSSASHSSMPSELSMTSDTWAKPMAGLLAVPPKMTSCIFPPLSVLELCSPITQSMASEILDFPEPFGPTMAVMSLRNSSLVLSGKDLNPCISSALRYVGIPLPHSLSRSAVLPAGLIPGGN